MAKFGPVALLVSRYNDSHTTRISETLWHSLSLQQQQHYDKLRNVVAFSLVTKTATLRQAPRRCGILSCYKESSATTSSDSLWHSLLLQQQQRHDKLRGVVAFSLVTTTATPRQVPRRRGILSRYKDSNTTTSSEASWHSLSLQWQQHYDQLRGVVEFSLVTTTATLRPAPRRCGILSCYNDSHTTISSETLSHSLLLQRQQHHDKLLGVVAFFLLTTSTPWQTPKRFGIAHKRSHDLWDLLAIF